MAVHIRGGEINCPCCPSRTFVAPDKKSFQLTCPWTGEKNLIPRCLKNTISFPNVAANTHTRRY